MPLSECFEYLLNTVCHQQELRILGQSTATIRTLGTGEFVVFDVSSNVIWIVGLVLLVLALAFLWNMKLSNHAEPLLTLEKETEPNGGDPEVTARRYQGMPVLAPAPPPVEIVVEDTAIEDEHAEDITEQPSTAIYEETPDSDDAERMLELAWKLEVNGDYEGRDEFASMVVDKTDASPRQRDRAQAMLRRDSIA